MRSHPSILQFYVCIFLALAVFARAQQSNPTQTPVKPPARLISPEVHADGTVTFRFRAPHAYEVKLAREGAQPVAMEKDEQGVWSLTTAPLPPDYYGYSLIADGVRLIDPSNPLLKPNLLATENMVHVPGTPSLPWELNDVPHGEIHHEFYKSAVAGDDRDFYVYTPPGYDSAGKQAYPVLYLLHGFSDDASGWIAVGRANVILDNLIAQDKTKPMIVVMPLGYGTMDFVRPGQNTWADTELRDRNFKKFTEALLSEVIPKVESEYRVKRDRNAHFPFLDSETKGAKANQQLHLLWIACGTDDHLITLNRSLRAWLKSRGVQHTAIETPGGHGWMLWRRNLADFASLLFR